MDTIISSILSLVVYIMNIDITYKIAKQNHRNTKIALLLAFLFPFWSLAGYFYAGKPKTIIK